jgi:hypothetical protein
MPNTTTISAADVSLFHVAVRTLGDATQWNRIAALNGLLDPWLFGLSAPITISLPSVDSTQGGGLPAQ